MNKRKAILFVLLTLFLSVYSCKKKEKKIAENVKVVTLGDFSVPENRVIRSFEFSKEFQKNKVITPELIKKYINRYYLGEIYLLAEAKNQGLDKDPEFLKAMKEHKIGQMTKMNGPLYKTILPKNFNVSNDELAVLYKHLPYRLTLQQILVTSKPLADSLYQLLIHGADFGKLASKYSNDLRTAIKGGVLSNYITAGMAAPEFEQAAFSLTEEHPISKPVKTEFGYHIIKLMSREKMNVGTMVQEKLKLVDIAKQRGRNEFIRHYIDSLFNKYHYKVNETYFPAILHAFKRNGIFGRLQKDKIDPKILNAKFLTYDKGFWTVEDFVDAYNKLNRYDRYRLERPEDIRIMAKKLISRELMYWDGVDRGLEKDETYRKFIDYYYRHELEKIGEKRLIDENIKITDDELKDYFKKHRNLWKNSTFEKVRAFVRNRLYSEKRRQFRKEFMAYLKKKYQNKVKYNEDALNRLAKLMSERKQQRG